MFVGCAGNWGTLPSIFAISQTARLFDAQTEGRFSYTSKVNADS